eukprot:jgi/Galph1/674/GphlegSOOS_G5408.1
MTTENLNNTYGTLPPDNHITWMEYQALLYSFPMDSLMQRVEEWLQDQLSATIADPCLERAAQDAKHSIDNAYPPTSLENWEMNENNNPLQDMSWSSVTYSSRWRRTFAWQLEKASRIGLLQFMVDGKYLACVSAIDTITLFSLQQEPTYTLRSHLQRNIRSMAFRPHSRWQLAVGCMAGIAWWRRHELNWLQWKNHTHIESLSWSPDGTLLASFSRNDGYVVLWDVGISECIVLCRERKPVSILSFCPDFSYFMVGYYSSLYFTLYDPLTWTPERWQWKDNGILGPWNNNIYKEKQVVWSETIPFPFPSANDASQQKIHCVEWDPTGQRLAIALTSNHEAREYIALYATQCQIVFHMSLIGWIVGGKGKERHHQHVLSMTFQPHCDYGAFYCME